MSTKYKIRDQTKIHFVTMTVVRWIDVFTRPETREIITESLKFCQKEKGLEIYAWCLMTNHLHMITGRNGPMRIEDIIRDFKSFTSRSIRKLLESNVYAESRKDWMLSMMYEAGQLNSNNRDFQFWQQHNHPIELYSNKLMEQKLEYIHQNPVKAGFVESPEHWRYSSAADYVSNRKGLLDIIFIE